MESATKLYSCLGFYQAAWMKIEKNGSMDTLNNDL